MEGWVDKLYVPLAAYSFKISFFNNYRKFFWSQYPCFASAGGTLIGLKPVALMRYEVR
jgi:hypothetical protein